jgi:hypothetical protein
LRNSQCVRAVVAASRTALAGLPRLSELSPSDVATRLVRRPLLAVVFGHEVFRRPVCFGPASEAAPAGLGPSQGALPRFRVPASRPGPSPPGVSCPFDDVGGRIRTFPGLPPRHDPSSRFLTSATGCSPLRLAATRAAAVHGVLTLIQGRFGHRAATRPRCRGHAASRSFAAGFPLPQL